jgi:hypothetical protein
MTNPLSPEEFSELRDLIFALHERSIGPEESARLEEWICHSEEARRVYVQYMHLHARLYWEKQTPKAASGSLHGTSKVQRTPILGFLGDVFQAGIDFLSRPLVLTLLVTIGLPGILVLLLMFHLGSQPAPVNRVAVEASRQTTPAVVARLTDVHEGVWEKSQPELSTGCALTAGQLLELRKGLVSLTFANGARVILEGPAAFRVNAGARGFLQVGKLVAHVSKGAERFAVATPSATIVDLGTEFGLSVDSKGVTEAHVFHGKVQVAVESVRRDWATLQQPLKAGQAVRILASRNRQEPPRIEPIDLSSTEFVRHLPGALPEPTIIFAHRGATDPTTEGWGLHGKDLADLGKEGYEVGPVIENGTPAWSFRSPEDSKGTYYAITPSEELTPALIAEAKQKGWVYRARVWVDPELRPPANQKHGACLFSYRDDELSWGIDISLDPEGNQLLLVNDADEAIPIPGSRDKYVDYEVRCRPGTDKADVMVNGHFVAMKSGRSRMMGMKGSYPTIRFGMRESTSHSRCDLFEWGILRGSSEPSLKPADADRDR